jgi:urease accessory protein
LDRLSELPLSLRSRVPIYAAVTIVFTDRLSHQDRLEPTCTLSLTAEERTRSRLHGKSDQGTPLYLQLPRGLVLQEGDWLKASTGEVIQVLAKEEAVLTVTAMFPLALLQAAYHLGNRHVPMEITATYLRIAPDPVLRHLLEHRGLTVQDEMAPFQPETGAYTSTHAHAHSHSHESHSHEPHSHGPHSHEPHSHEPHSHEPHSHEPHPVH